MSGRESLKARRLGSYLIFTREPPGDSTTTWIAPFFDRAGRDSKSVTIVQRITPFSVPNESNRKRILRTNDRSVTLLLLSPVILSYDLQKTIGLLTVGFSRANFLNLLANWEGEGLENMAYALKRKETAEESISRLLKCS